MARLRIQAFGGLQVFGPAQQPLPLPAKKAQALLAYLALQPGRAHARAKLAALLWGDSGERQARASLRQALLVLRRTLALDEDELFARPAETIELAAGCIDVDVLEFERLAGDDSTETLESAAALYIGQFLEGVDTREPAYDDWLAARRQQLRERAVDALSRLLVRHTDSGRTDRGIDAALRLLALDPLQESVHRTLMQLYAKQGRHAAALRQFQVCRDLLAHELGAQPQAQTVQVRDEIQRHRQAPPTRDDRTDPPGAAAQAELRLVAFVVAESTRIAEALDPERAQAASERFAAAASEVVERFGGHFERRLAAGITAFFGAPIAHGDDTERAARCALALRALSADVDVGMSAGLALVTHESGGTSQHLRISGEGAGLAARLAAAAEPGAVLVPETVWRSLSRHAEGRRHAASLPASLKTMNCWQLTGMRPAAAARAALVGRRKELSQFAGSLRACLQSGSGLTMHVRGDPGIGKTRLVEEFRDIAITEGFTCHTGLVLDFGIGAERDAVRSLVRGLLDVQGDGAQAERTAIERALAAGLVERAHELPLLDLLQQPLPPALRAVFDAMDPPTRTRGLHDALASLLRRCSADKPRFIVLEDMHWAPPRTVRQAATLSAAAEHCAAVLVMTARTDSDPLNAAWRSAAGVSALVTLDLGPLRWTEASALAAQLGTGDEAFTLRCVERSGGNPLFLEQLLEAGSAGSDSALPGSVQSVVQARLDGLDAVERNTVRVASVLGQRFPLAALDHLLGASPAWGSGFARGLLRNEEGEGVFAHSLVHDGAYASLPRALRRELHDKAARWFSGRDPILRAEHLDRAEKPEAAQAYLDAARTESAEHRHERALQLAERGLALVGETGLRFELACCRADRLHELGSMTEAQAGYDEALAAAGNDIERCRAWLGIAAVLRIRDDLDGAARALARAEEAAVARGLTEERARIHFLRGNLLFPRGDLAGCQREHEQCLALAREAGSVEVEAAALGGLGDAEFLRGHMLTARQRFDACVTLAQRHGLKRIEAAHRPMAAFARGYAGDTRGALEDAQAAIGLAARIGHRRAEAIAHHGGYQFSHALMAFDAALDHAERALLLARQIDAPRFEAEALAFRGELLRATGRHAQARDDLQHALAIARATGMAFMGPVFLGMLALAADDVATRNDALAEAEALLAHNNLAHNHLLFRRDAIDACLDAGDPDGAMRHAAALETRSRSEPLPWSEFFIARGRALAVHAADVRAPATRAVLMRLREDGQRMGLLVSVVALDAALASCRPG